MLCSPFLTALSHGSFMHLWGKNVEEKCFTTVRFWCSSLLKVLHAASLVHFSKVHQKRIIDFYRKHINTACCGVFFESGVQKMHQKGICVFTTFFEQSSVKVPLHNPHYFQLYLVTPELNLPGSFLKSMVTAACLITPMRKDCSSMNIFFSSPFT